MLLSDLRKITRPGPQEYRVTGRMGTLEEPKLEFRVHFMDLMSDDKHSMRLDPKHVPNPAVSNRRSGAFHLSLGVRIVYSRSRRMLLMTL